LRDIPAAYSAFGERLGWQAHPPVIALRPSVAHKSNHTSTRRDSITF
jgi:hypothetical protein